MVENRYKITVHLFLTLQAKDFFLQNTILFQVYVVLQLGHIDGEEHFLSRNTGMLLHLTQIQKINQGTLLLYPQTSVQLCQ